MEPPSWPQTCHLSGLLAKPTGAAVVVGQLVTQHCCGRGELIHTFQGCPTQISAALLPRVSSAPSR